MRRVSPYLVALVGAYVGTRIGAAADLSATGTGLAMLAVAFPLGFPVALWAGWFDPPSRRADEPPHRVG